MNPKKLNNKQLGDGKIIYKYFLRNNERCVRTTLQTPRIR